MDEKLKSLIVAVTDESLFAWTDPKMVGRAHGYLDKIGLLAEVKGNGIVAHVRGTDDYVTHVWLNEEGAIESECSCPVGHRCKHAVAAILSCSRRLAAGEPVGTLPEDGNVWRSAQSQLADVRRRRQEAAKAKDHPQPPPEVRHIRVETNPFDRFTASGGRHAKSFSFRVAGPDGIYHWDFIVATLAYSLAKGGLAYSEDRLGWWEGREGSEPPMFTCSCGDPRCGGFGDQRCIFDRQSVLWRVEYGGATIVEFEFDRIRYEYWALSMIWRMRGSFRLRRDPWKSLADKTAFDSAVSALLNARPRCLAIWSLIRQKRRLDESDFARLAQMPAGDNDAAYGCGLMHFFPCEFSTKGRLDLDQSGPTYGEKMKAEESMCAMRMERTGLFVYSYIIGRHWESTAVAHGEEILFVRETGNGRNARSIRVDNAAKGTTIGFLKRADAHWLSDMMDRHGLVLKGHVEPLDRDGKAIPVRIDIAFQDSNDTDFDWGATLPDRDRLYFEMLRAVVLKPERFSAAVVKSEIKRIESLLCGLEDCPEIMFLFALLTAAAKELEHRLTQAEIAKRRAYCKQVRRAFGCNPDGGLLDAGGFKILPLKAVCADAALSAKDAMERMYRWIRLSWMPPVYGTDQKVSVRGFPEDATGFAVFRGRELLDVCLCGIPVSSLGLFDSIACYDGEGEGAVPLSSDAAFGIVEKFLAELPIRERDNNGSMPGIWFERGIHDGWYDIDKSGRLIAMRILMLAARRKWVD